MRAEFAEWITQQEGAMKDNDFPEGWKYRGTFCTRFSHSDYEYAMLLEIDKYARLDDFWKSDRFAMTIGELNSFLDGVPQWTFYEPTSLSSNEQNAE